MAWVYVALASISEIGFAWPLKAGAGPRRPGLALLCLASILVSVWLLEQAFRTLPTSTAYPVWVGLGTVGTTLVGVRFYGERLRAAQFAYLALLLAAVAGLGASGA